MSLAPPLRGIRLNIMSKHLQETIIWNRPVGTAMCLKRFSNDFQTQRLNMSMHVPILSGGCKVTCHGLWVRKEPGRGEHCNTCSHFNICGVNAQWHRVHDSRLMEKINLHVENVQTLSIRQFHQMIYAVQRLLRLFYMKLWSKARACQSQGLIYSKNLKRFPLLTEQCWAEENLLMWNIE